MTSHSTFRFGASTFAALIVSGVVLATPPANATTEKSPAWKVVETQSLHKTSFTAVTAVSATSAWAFGGSQVQGAKPTAWHLSGSNWAQQPFPGLPGERVIVARSSASNNVWVFTSNRRVLKWNGTRWSGEAKLPRAIGSAVVINQSDIWAYADPYSFNSSPGVWHYNGSNWLRSGPQSLQGASALSAKAIWAFGGNSHHPSVAHWNGDAWATFSVANLLPKDTITCVSRVTGVFAASPTSVWAAATGGCQDFLGPFVLLHFNGTRWSRIATNTQKGAAVAIVSDGHGGLWLPVGTGSPPESSMLHYSSGHLGSAGLPISPTNLTLLDASSGRTSTTALAVGSARPSHSTADSTGVILRYGP